MTNIPILFWILIGWGEGWPDYYQAYKSGKYKPIMHIIPHDCTIITKKQGLKSNFKRIIISVDRNINILYFQLECLEWAKHV